MAWIKEQKRKSGTSAYCVVYSRNGKRKYISLGSNYTRRNASEIAANVERILTAEQTGQPLDKQTASWIASISEDLKARLVASELLDVKTDLTLSDVWREYWNAEHYELKPTTQQNKRNSRNHFFEYFPPDMIAGKVTPEEASAFQLDLKSRDLAPATVAGIIRDVKRVFNFAVEKGFIDKSPFAGVKRGNFLNKTRETYISLETFLKLLDAAPSALWRSILCLYRLEGLRCSEPLYLRWQDVDFEQGRLLITSPKTERYKGQETRYAPLFPTVSKELLKLWKEQGEPAPGAYIVDRNRTTIYKHISQIVFLAGIEPYPRLIQNLRSSRAIEIYRKFGAIAEREWLGHSERTAAEHYLHVLQSDFTRAATLDELEGIKGDAGETSP